MKSFLYLVIALAMTHTAVLAQQEPPTKPAWAPATGYWVAEGNLKQPKLCTIYFYNNDNTLIYKEKIEGVKLRLHSRRVKMRLKKVLEESLWAWQKDHQAKENEGLVINLLHGK